MNNTWKDKAYHINVNNKKDYILVYSLIIFHINIIIRYKIQIIYKISKKCLSSDYLKTLLFVLLFVFNINIIHFLRSNVDLYMYCNIGSCLLCLMPILVD